MLFKNRLVYLLSVRKKIHHSLHRGLLPQPFHEILYSTIVRGDKALDEIKERGLTECQRRSMEMLDYERNYIVTSYSYMFELRDENQFLP